MSLDGALASKQTELTERGFCILPSVLNASAIQEWCALIERSLDRNDSATLLSNGLIYGARDLIRQCPKVIELARLEAVQLFLLDCLGDEWGLVRGLYFDKPPELTWNLPWHRDRTIAVQQHHSSTTYFRNPTTKAGVPHYVAPNELLRQMVTLRFHLDPMTPDNGPVVVIPGSHVTEVETDEAPERGIEEIHCSGGDLFVMRPLLLHSSVVSKEGTDMHRRVVHLEFSSLRNLPDSICWRTFLR